MSNYNESDWMLGAHCKICEKTIHRMSGLALHDDSCPISRIDELEGKIADTVDFIQQQINNLEGYIDRAGRHRASYEVNLLTRFNTILRKLEE